MKHTGHAVGRREVLMLASAALTVAIVGSSARAGTGPSGPVFGPVEALDDALIAAMKSGDATSFNRRCQALAPVIDRVFELHAVLAASIGLSWAGIPEAQKTTLAAAFRRYTVSSYAANFDSYNGQRFEILHDARIFGNGKAVVQTRLIRRDKSAIKIDYVLRSGTGGWQVVDVLTDGTISRVAVQRSDFRQLLESGGAPALTAGLERKVANLSGSMQG